MEASNLSTLTRRINTIAVHWLPQCQDRCYRASRELCSNYAFFKSSRFYCTKKTKYNF